MPTVSVILPTFNRVRFLGEAVASALAQTWPKLQIIIVDDGSTDDTGELVSSFAREDDRICYVRQENAGVSAARNRALRMATGDYVAFLDSDDVWNPWKIELQLDVLRQQKNIGMVWTNMDAIYPDGTPLQSSFLRSMYHAYDALPTGHPFASLQPLRKLLPLVDDTFASASTGVGNIYRQMFGGNLVHTPTVMLRREWASKVGPFDTAMRRGGEDFKFHLSTCRLGDVAFVDVASILYRVGNGDQITNHENNLCFAQSYLRTIREELAEFRAESNLSDREIARLMSKAHDWLGREYLTHGQNVSSFVHALHAIRFRKTPGESWKTMTKCLVPAQAIRLAKALMKRRPNANPMRDPVREGRERAAIRVSKAQTNETQASASQPDDRRHAAV